MTQGPGRVAAHYRVNLDISTVTEHLLVSAAHACVHNVILVTIL